MSHKIKASHFYVTIRKAPIQYPGKPEYTTGALTNWTCEGFMQELQKIFPSNYICEPQNLKIGQYYHKTRNQMKVASKMLQVFNNEGKRGCPT